MTIYGQGRDITGPARDECPSMEKNLIKQDSTTNGLSPEKLARLLKLAVENKPALNKVDYDQERAEMLQGLLSKAVPSDPALLASIPRIIQYLCNELLPAGAASVGDLLNSPETDLATLRQIKSYGKELAAKKDSPEHEVGTAVYYAAIASALLRHDEKISMHSAKELLDAFSVLGNKSWMSEDLASLFKQACSQCVGTK